jgi:hypothetical protein
MSFADDLLRWQGFFTLLGEATASFAGLLFVSLAVNPERLRSPGAVHIKLLARQTFFNLMVLTTLSLLAISPMAKIDTIGGLVTGGCLGGLMTCAAAIKAEIRARKAGVSTMQFIRAYYGPALVYAFLIFPAYHMATTRENDLQGIGWGAIMLCITSARNAWLLLVAQAA